jgi:AcrR family transcriptional regulator
MKRSTSRGSPKGNKRERTRARLIDAAATVIGEKGWDLTSLEEVARRAGMTRGAIYGNFTSREELFLAVVQTRWKPVSAQYVPGSTFEQHMHAVGKAVAIAGPERRAEALGALSFMLYALTHEELRGQFVRLNTDIYRRMAHGLTKAFGRGELPMPPERLIPVLHALSDGLTFLRFLMPELITEKVIIGAFDALGRRSDGGASSKSGRAVRARARRRRAEKV